MTAANPLEPGMHIQLRPGVLFGPVVVLTVTHAFKNGNIRAKRYDDNGKVITEVWKIHHSQVTRCKEDTLPDLTWIAQISGERINRFIVLTSEDIKYLRSLYAEQWTKDKPRLIMFPSGVVVPREVFQDFVDGKTVWGWIDRENAIKKQHTDQPEKLYEQIIDPTSGLRGIIEQKTGYSITRLGGNT